MAAFLEVLQAHEPRLVRLEGDRVTVGKDPSNDLALPADATLSRLHAAFERYPTGWCVRDLDSRNGTFVNGERIRQERPLRHGDEVLVGASRLRYRNDVPAASVAATAAAEPPPELTRRERDVLRELCRTLLAAEPFTEPASLREVAAALVVSEAAVKQHLLRLYDKFGVHGQDQRRRVRLANEALRRGAVTMAELRAAVERRGGQQR
jgi:DNA-binding CsgD family transcriptional regulator